MEMEISIWYVEVSYVLGHIKLDCYKINDSINNCHMND